MDQVGVAVSGVARDSASTAALPETVGAVTEFTTGLYRRIATRAGNVVCSPYSVAVALAMTRNGACGRTAAEMDHVLHGGPDELNPGLHSLTQALEERLEVANSLWGQHDTRWEHRFLDALARYYGAGPRLVDYRTDADGARALINAWTAEQTRDRVPRIIPDGAIDALTRLVLVNTVHFKAPWLEPFERSLTSRQPFHRMDGSEVEVDMMSGELSRAAYAEGTGWQAARLGYLGGELAMAVVVPDARRLETLEAALDGDRLRHLLGGFRPVPEIRLEMPRWKFRVHAELNDHLSALGMPTAFDPRTADFSGMTTQEPLYISHVLHQAFIAVDEEGTEAAGATAVVMRTVSARVNPIVLRADRPFLFIVYDVETTTPLFIGRVSEPEPAA